MFILMLRTMRGSNDGIKVEKFVEGQKYKVPQELSHSLCEVFISNKYAKKVEGDVLIENKMIEEEDVELLDDIVEDVNPIEHKVFARTDVKETPSRVVKKTTKSKKPNKK